MKKLLASILALVMIFSAMLTLTSCNGDGGAGGAASDWETIEERGFFYCGITVYAPMNYYDEEDNLVGFDTEFAMAVADYLGVEAKFSTIKWPSKYLELNSKAIDLIWNGFTYGAEDGVPDKVDRSAIELKILGTPLDNLELSLNAKVIRNCLCKLCIEANKIAVLVEVVHRSVYGDTANKVTSFLDFSPITRIVGLAAGGEAESSTDDHNDAEQYCQKLFHFFIPFSCTLSN